MKFTIRVKLLIGFSTILLLSLLVQGFVFFNTNQYITSQIIEFQTIQVNKGSTNIQNFFEDLGNDSFSLARIYQNNPQDFPAAANYAIKSSTYIKRISVLSPLGKELIKFDTRGRVGQDKLTYEVFSEPFHSAVAGRTAISRVYYTERTLGPHIDLFSPIFGRDNKVLGIVKTQINLTLLNNELKDIKLNEGGYVYVVDNEGRLIAHPSENYVLERPNLSSREVVSDRIEDKDNGDAYEYVNEKNVSVIAHSAKIPGYDWVIVFEQPKSEAFGFLEFIRTLFIATVIASTFLLIILAVVLSENLTRPIIKLQKLARQISRGDYSKSLIIKSGDEIESLSQSFAHLVDQLLMRERSLEKTSTELSHANKKLKQLDTLKNEFVSVASHELRTPMTAIKSYLWMALEGKGGELNTKQRYYVQRGYNSVDRLIRLVNDMLNISRIEAGRITINMQKVDLSKLAQEVVDEVQPRAKEVGVSVNVVKHDHLSHVLGDPDKLKEVYFNLIGNSLKFTPEGGKVTVEFREKDDFVETVIKDTGSGIDADDIGKLFQKFGLLPGSYTTNQPAMGTGLGLYICRSIVELHHGKIWAESEGRGKGATFTFQVKKFSKEDQEQLTPKHEKKDSVDLIHSDI